MNKRLYLWIGVAALALLPTPTSAMYQQPGTNVVPGNTQIEVPGGQPPAVTVLPPGVWIRPLLPTREACYCPCVCTCVCYCVCW